MPGKRTCHQLKSTNSREYLKFAIIFALEITKIGITELFFQPNFFLSTLYTSAPPPPHTGEKSFWPGKGWNMARAGLQIKLAYLEHTGPFHNVSLYTLTFPFPTIYTVTIGFHF